MILVLCDSYEAAKELYFFFIEWVKVNDSEAAIANQYDPGLCVELDDDLMYIFIDQKWLSIVERDINEPLDIDYAESFEAGLLEMELPFL